MVQGILSVSHINGNDIQYEYVDLIRFKELDEAIMSQRAGHIVSYHPESMRYAKLRYNPLQIPIVNGIRLTFQEGDNTDGGDMDLLWADMGEVLCSKPVSVTWTSPTGKVFEPKFSFLDHKESAKDPCFLILNGSSFSPQRTVLHKKQFDDWREMFDSKTLIAIDEFLTDKIHAPHNREFSVGSMFPKESPHWENELRPIYETLKDELLAAYFLSGFVQLILIKSPYTWAATKTRMKGRDFDTLFFWIHDRNEA